MIFYDIDLHYTMLLVFDICSVFSVWCLIIAMSIWGLVGRVLPLRYCHCRGYGRSPASPANEVPDQFLTYPGQWSFTCVFGRYWLITGVPKSCRIGGWWKKSYWHTGSAFWTESYFMEWHFRFWTLLHEFPSQWNRILHQTRLSAKFTRNTQSLRFHHSPSRIYPPYPFEEKPRLILLGVSHNGGTKNPGRWQPRCPPAGNWDQCDLCHIWDISEDVIFWVPSLRPLFAMAKKDLNGIPGWLKPWQWEIPETRWRRYDRFNMV